MLWYFLEWSIVKRSSKKLEKVVFTTVTFNTRPRKVFFSPLKPEVFRGGGGGGEGGGINELLP